MMMRTQTRTQLTSKGRGPSRVTTQQVAFELKHKVVYCLNKLSDRDTYQIGVDELEKMAEALTPDGMSTFLSCILDTDAEQKSAVRKECIRLMGTLAKFHDHLLGPHLNKIIASIVKRLKDPDSVVRDACAETVGVLASKLGHNDGVFVALVRPLFEALGEQNKQVQSGSALCLARVIDNIHNPPISILERLLTKTTKLLKNPHFMGKPALLDLNRSIIQVSKNFKLTFCLFHLFCAFIFRCSLKEILLTEPHLGWWCYHTKSSLCCNVWHPRRPKG